MDETPEQKFNRISRAVQESILRNYPNPERKGCPGDDKVREVAARTELKADDAWEHITHCSPCYRTFLDCKEQFRNRRKMRRRAAVGILAAAAASIPIVLITQFRPHSYDRLIGEWNLEVSSSSRGSDTGPEGSVSPQNASRSRGHIRVSLPLGSEAGEYRLQVRKTQEGPAVERATGMASIYKGHTVISFPVDFSDLPAGSYFAAIGRGDKMWRVYPLTLE